MSIADIRYTKKEWESYLPALRTFSESTLKASYMVLVEGKSFAEVARDVGTTRQTVHVGVKRTVARLEKNNAAQLVPVLVWVTKDQVKKVEKYAVSLGGQPDQ